MRGTAGSSKFNDFMVTLKIAVVLAFIVIGFKYINTDNLTPFIPQNTGVFGQYGWSGILRGAAIVFLHTSALMPSAQLHKRPRTHAETCQSAF